MINFKLFYLFILWNPYIKNIIDLYNFSSLRYLSTLKFNVHNWAHPKGSIVEAYLLVECLTFCSSYLQGAEARSNRSIRNHANIDPKRVQGSYLFLNVGWPYGSIKIFSLDKKIRIQAHRYVLNCDCSIAESLKK